MLAPDVLAASRVGEDLDYVATLALAGRALWVQPDLSGATRTRVLRASGEQLRALHEIQLDGYGRDARTDDDRTVRMPVYLLATAVVLMAEEVRRKQLPVREGPPMILPKVRDPRFVTIRRGGTLTDSDHHLLALWAAACAEHVLDLFEFGAARGPVTA